MLYYMAPLDRKDELLPKSINYLKSVLRSLPTDFKYSIVYTPRHIIEARLPAIFQDDILLWHPKAAANNLDLVIMHQSFVLLLNRTIYIQKLSERNPINENLAMNNNFKLLYIDETFSDVTNQDYKLAVPEDDYRITGEQFHELLIKSNKTR